MSLIVLLPQEARRSLLMLWVKTSQYRPFLVFPVFMLMHIWKCAAQMALRVTSTFPLGSTSAQPFNNNTHTPPPRAQTCLALLLPPGGERRVWERESDWLSGLASSPTACQLGVYSCTTLGVPHSQPQRSHWTILHPLISHKQTNTPFFPAPLATTKLDSLV